MPKAIFTSAGREAVLSIHVLASAKRIKTSKTEDQFETVGCRVTSRYRIKGGDFVSDQILGCFNAIEAGELHCKKRKVALIRISESRTVIGIVGPDDEVDKLAISIGKAVHGVIVTGDAAIVVE